MDTCSYCNKTFSPGAVLPVGENGRDICLDCSEKGSEEFQALVGKNYEEYIIKGLEEAFGMDKKPCTYCNVVMETLHLRPYGKGGRDICFDCFQKGDEELKKTVEDNYEAVLDRVLDEAKNNQVPSIEFTNHGPVARDLTKEITCETHHSK